MSSVIRKATLEDIHQIYDLYKAVTKHNPGNLTQEDYEVTIDYVEEMVKAGLERGIVLVAQKDDKIISYLKAFTSKFKCLAHTLGDVTSMSHPDYQNLGYGVKLWLKGINEVKTGMRHILRIEIVPHESNSGVINMHQRVGFKIESKCDKKIRNHSGDFGDEVILSWSNPNFSVVDLNKYHDYLQTKYFTNKDKMVDIYKNKKTYSSDNIINLSTTNNILADDIKKNLNRSFSF